MINKNMSQMCHMIAVHKVEIWRVRKQHNSSHLMFVLQAASKIPLIHSFQEINANKTLGGVTSLQQKNRLKKYITLVFSIHTMFSLSCKHHTISTIFLSFNYCFGYTEHIFPCITILSHIFIIFTCPSCPFSPEPESLTSQLYIKKKTKTNPNPRPTSCSIQLRLSFQSC